MVHSLSAGWRSAPARWIGLVSISGLVFIAVFIVVTPPTATAQPQPRPDSKGQEIFRFDTFGDEQLWTDRLRMHEVIETAVDPTTAVNVLGLKVDAAALPPELVTAIENGDVDLEDPATTVALIKLNAVVGLVGKVETVDGVDRLREVGITCAICHSTVDDSFAFGIGNRLDGWPNLDLDPGAIIAASPAITEEQRAVYRSWGPGKYDPRFNIDGLNTPLVLPPAFGLRDVDKETYTGEGPISYWNAYVAVTQMGGRGNFSDPRLGENGINIVHDPDLVTPKLDALRAYQFSLETPPPPPDSFDAAAAKRGKRLFNGGARCANCHIPPLYTDVNLGILHDAEETGMDPAYAERTTTGKYRTTPLRALWQHPPYFHDGSAATLQDVVEHYDAVLNLRLTAAEQRDLVEFLKSL
jgi:mono/diheme cytochrome c family protein